MLHYAQMIPFFPKVSTRFEPCSVFSSYTCSLYDRIIFCDPPTTPCDSHPCDPPNPKIRGKRLPQDQRRQSVLRSGGRESGRRNFRFEPILLVLNSKNLSFSHKKDAPHQIFLIKKTFSNIPFVQKIRYTFFRNPSTTPYDPPCDPLRPPAWNLGSRPQTPPGLTPLPRIDEFLQILVSPQYRGHVYAYDPNRWLNN